MTLGSCKGGQGDIFQVKINGELNILLYIDNLNN